MPNADTVSAIGDLPWPALIVLALLVGVLGATFIVVKFGEGRKAQPKTEDFQVRLATFDPAQIAVLIQEISRNTDGAEDHCRCLQELGRDMREFCRVVQRTLKE
jgi:hypothetical protein